MTCTDFSTTAAFLAASFLATAATANADTATVTCTAPAAPPTPPNLFALPWSTTAIAAASINLPCCYFFAEL
jgi:hypothetical protein